MFVCGMRMIPVATRTDMNIVGKPGLDLIEVREGRSLRG